MVVQDSIFDEPVTGIFPFSGERGFEERGKMTV
jgi:hypothetical protein